MAKVQSCGAMFSTLALGAFLFFAWFGRLADGAMNKSGLGDVYEWQRYSMWAGVSFWVMLVFWVLALACVQRAPKAERSRLLFIVGLLAPLMVTGSYLALLCA